MSSRVHIRWSVRRDVPAIVEIETASFLSPWSADDFRSVLSQRNCIMMVAEHNHEIIGYVIYELHPAHLTLLNFAIHPDYRRQRIGTALLDKLIYKLLSHRRMHLKAVVSESNDAAQLFFHRAGFNAVSIARKSYRDSDEDAYEMVYRPTEQQWENFGGAPVNRISAYELP